jgi:hypothetical protein
LRLAETFEVYWVVKEAPSGSSLVQPTPTVESCATTMSPGCKLVTVGMAVQLEPADVATTPMGASTLARVKKNVTWG